MARPEPLSDVEAAAWRAMVVFWRQGFPQLERTFRRAGLNHLEYGFLAVLSEQADGAMPAGELAALAGISSSRLSHRLRQATRIVVGRIGAHLFGERAGTAHCLRRHREDSSQA